MKRTLIVLPLTMSLHFHASAQFSFLVFPMGVIGDAYADTLLNTRAILSRERITQVKAYQTSPELTRTFASKTLYLDPDGHINKVMIYFAKNDSGFVFCVTDTVLYDKARRMVEIKTTDNRQNKYPLNIVEYINEKESKYENDSAATYKYYNDEVQVVRIRGVWKGQEGNTYFYYNKDGLLDSTVDQNLGTFIFQRRRNGKMKVIEMQNFLAKYQWVYNAAGQCVSSIFKDRPNIIRDPPVKGGLKVEIHYYYNSNGTLSKITIRNSDKPMVTVYYSYLK